MSLTEKQKEYKTRWKNKNPEYSRRSYEKRVGKKVETNGCSIGGCVQEVYHWNAVKCETHKLQCRYPGCGQAAPKSSLCSDHYSRSKGVPRKPKSGWRLTSDGYVFKTETVKGVTTTTFQHRQVMEQELGRPLLPGENVHHKNGVRHDNRAKNLELWVTMQPSGQRPEDLLEWAEEVFRRYRV